VNSNIIEIVGALQHVAANHRQWSIIHTSEQRRRGESTQYRSYKVRVCDTRDTIKAAAIVCHAVFVRIHPLTGPHTHSWNVISLRRCQRYCTSRTLSPVPRGIYKSTKVILTIQSAQ